MNEQASHPPNEFCGCRLVCDSLMNTSFSVDDSIPSETEQCCLLQSHVRADESSTVPIGAVQLLQGLPNIHNHKKIAEWEILLYLTKVTFAQVDSPDLSRVLCSSLQPNTTDRSSCFLLPIRCQHDQYLLHQLKYQ